MIEEDANLRANLEKMHREKAMQLAELLKKEIQHIGTIDYVEADCGDINPEMVKDIAFKLKNDFGRMCFVAYGNQNGKAVLNLLLGDELVAEGKDASKIIRQAAKSLQVCKTPFQRYETPFQQIKTPFYFAKTPFCNALSLSELNITINIVYKRRECKI